MEGREVSRRAAFVFLRWDHLSDGLLHSIGWSVSRALDATSQQAQMQVTLGVAPTW